MKMFNGSRQVKQQPFSKDKQLQRQNYNLREQLKNAYQTIFLLKSQIQKLKADISILKGNKQRIDKSTQIASFKKQLQLKSNNSIKLSKQIYSQMQVFTSQSQSQMQEDPFKPTLSVIQVIGMGSQRRQKSPKSKSKTNITFEYSQRQTQQTPIKGQQTSDKGKQTPGKSKQIKLKGKSSNEKLKKVDSTKFIHEANHFDIDPNQDLNASQFFAKQPKQTLATFNKSITTIGKTNTTVNNSHSTINNSNVPLNKSNTNNTTFDKSNAIINKSNTTINKNNTAMNQSNTTINISNTTMNQSNTTINISNTKSQRIISIPKHQLSSAIKDQGKVKFPKDMQKIKKVITPQPIYQSFFVTGISNSNQPCVLYSYPKLSAHSQAILSLCYSEEFLRAKESFSSNPFSCNNSHQSKIKQFFVVPLRKLTQQNIKQNLREYLIVCEVEDLLITEQQNNAFYFQRLFCFISSCQFFNVFKNLVNQFLDKLNTVKNLKFGNSLLKESQYQEILQQNLQQPLMTLSNKYAQANQTLRYRLDSFVQILIDIPPLQTSYKMVSEFHPWGPKGVMNLNVQIRAAEQYISNLETKLFGILLTYSLCEKKVILFSSSKSKLSECIIHFLQIIKPLQYVCPILMTALKQQHQQYFSAPMSLLIGLWTQQKKMQKQKIQIFMNRKENLAGMIEKGKTHINDGIIINLDTGLIYGHGIDEQLNSLALKFNYYYQNYCHQPKQIFSLFQTIFGTKQHDQIDEDLLEIKKKLIQSIKHTQIFMYHKERKNKA